jgi:hypothetical protein
MHLSDEPAEAAEYGVWALGTGLIEAVLGVSRALVAVAARSLAVVAEDVTLAQYRVLVELASKQRRAATLRPKARLRSCVVSWRQARPARMRPCECSRGA